MNHECRGNKLKRFDYTSKQCCWRSESERARLRSLSFQSLGDSFRVSQLRDDSAFIVMISSETAIVIIRNDAIVFDKKEVCTRFSTSRSHQRTMNINCHGYYQR